jgi:hypothetical protein
MGRMDRSGVHDLNHCFGRGDLCNEADSGQPQSQEEEDCEKCRDERGKFLQPAKHTAQDRSREPADQRGAKDADG